MTQSLPSSLPDSHRHFLIHAVEQLAQQSWLIGIGATGSFAADTMDEFSDLDFVLAVEDPEYAAVMENRRSIAESLGHVLAVFTGEHVGDPRLLLCLYGPPLIHVDFKFLLLPDTAKRVDDVVVLWERDGRLSTVLQECPTGYSPPNPQWIEDRFWVWIHKAGGKIGRGELFEAIEYLAFVRSKVLGPLCLNSEGHHPSGLRRIESAVPILVEDLTATLARHSAFECLVALRASVELYCRLRASEKNGLQYRREAESAVTEYLTEIESHIRTIQ